MNNLSRLLRCAAGGFCNVSLEGTVLTVLVTLALAGCEGNHDSVMWDCQLEALKGNAGKSAEAAAERARNIEACMHGHGYQLDVGNPSCQHGSVNSTCYLAKHK